MLISHFLTITAPMPIINLLSYSVPAFLNIFHHFQFSTTSSCHLRSLMSWTPDLSVQRCPRCVQLTPVLTNDSMILSLSARVSPCFILILFLSKHFMAYLTFTQQRLHTEGRSMTVAFTACILSSSHLSCVSLPAPVHLSEATSADDPVHAEVIHSQLRRTEVWIKVTLERDQKLPGLKAVVENLAKINNSNNSR